MTFRTTIQACLCAGVLAVAGCATTTGEDGELIADPYEGVNRSIHSFNKGADQYVLRPITQAYDYATPELVQHLVRNELNYLRLPGIFLNRLMQGEFEEAGAALARFALNTTIGAVGLLDPATEFGLPHTPTDFGVTLADWGVGEGAYLEVPFMGPHTARHAVGRVVGIALDPAMLVITGAVDLSTTWDVIYYSRTPLEIITARDDNFEVIDQILYDSADSYVAARSAYVQNRRRSVAGDETSVDQVPDIFGD